MQQQHQQHGEKPIIQTNKSRPIVDRIFPSPPLIKLKKLKHPQQFTMLKQLKHAPAPFARLKQLKYAPKLFVMLKQLKHAPKLFVMLKQLKQLKAFQTLKQLGPFKTPRKLGVHFTILHPSTIRGIGKQQGGLMQILLDPILYLNSSAFSFTSD